MVESDCGPEGRIDRALGELAQQIAVRGLPILAPCIVSGASYARASRNLHQCDAHDADDHADDLHGGQPFAEDHK